MVTPKATEIIATTLFLLRLSLPILIAAYLTRPGAPASCINGYVNSVLVLAIYGLIQECKAEDVEMGTRVQAVWKPDGERQGDHTDIKYFKPTGEPKAPLESFIHRL